MENTIMDTIGLPFWIGVMAAIIGNMLWYWLKAINKSKGYKSNLFMHSGDLRNFKEIISSENNPDIQKKYRLILKGTYACIAVLIVSLIITFAWHISQRP